jgi:hypothetical protein
MAGVEELREAIHRLHGVEAAHHESVPVKETFNGETVWEGIVEVFHLTGHPKTDTVYAWLHDTGDPEQPFRPVTVLRIHPALSPLAAVRAFIVQEFRANANANANAEA